MMTPENEGPAEETTQESQPPPASAPATQAVTTSASDAFQGLRERLGLQQSGVLIAAVALAGLAFFIATIGLIVYTTADGGDAEFDGQVTLYLALGAAIGSAALFVLARHQSGPRTSSDEGGRDLKVAYVLGGLTAVYCLLGLFKAFDESWSGQDGWFAYARVWVFLLIAWLAVARPVPDTIGGMASSMAGLVLVAIGGVLLVLGQFMGMSDDYSTWVNGIAFQNLGAVAMLAALGWFLGLQPKSG